MEEVNGLVESEVAAELFDPRAIPSRWVVPVCEEEEGDVGPSVGEGSAWSGAQSPGVCLRVARAVGGFRGVTTELPKMLCARGPHPAVLVHPRIAGLGLKGCLGPFSGAAAMGWGLCDAFGDFWPLSKPG